MPLTFKENEAKPKRAANQPHCYRMQAGEEEKRWECGREERNEHLESKNKMTRDTQQPQRDLMHKAVQSLLGIFFIEKFVFQVVPQE